MLDNFDCEACQTLLDECLNFKESKDKSIVSIYTVSEMMKLALEEQGKIGRKFEEKMYDIFKKNHNLYNHLKFSFYDFDYLEERLIVKEYDKKMIFKKDAIGVYLENCESEAVRRFFILFKDELDKTYDDFMKFKDSKNNPSLRVRSVNTEFLVDVFSYQVKCYLEKDDKEIFSVLSRCYADDYSGDFSKVRYLYPLIEEEFFKRIYVKISDMPKWSQEFLRKIREDEVEMLKRDERLKVMTKIKSFGRKKFNG